MSTKEKHMSIDPIIELMLELRSACSFKDAPIAREDLEAIAACGRRTPSTYGRRERTFDAFDAPARGEEHDACALGRAVAPGRISDHVRLAAWA